MSNPVLVTKTDGVMRITLNRAEKRNALTNAMYADLNQALIDATQDSSIRVVVLTGSQNVFTSGNDIMDFIVSSNTAQKPAFGDTNVGKFLNNIAIFPKPLIAAVSGLAVGVGSTLLLHCDLIYADESASLQFPFINIGLVPEAASSLMLPMLIGMPKAAEYFYFGEKILAQEALAVGLVNKIVPNVEDYAMERAAQLARLPAAALRQTKSLMRHSKTMTVSDRMEEEGVIFGERLSSPEAREAMMAFMQKRKPDFSQFN